MEYKCPNCNKILNLKGEPVSKNGKCAGCGKAFAIPVKNLISNGEDASTMPTKIQSEFTLSKGILQSPVQHDLVGKEPKYVASLQHRRE